MPHDHIDVRYVANLARLDLTEEEATIFQKQLESIMKHVESLSAIDLPYDLDVDENALLGLMRDDSPGESLAPELVLQNGPDQSQFQIRVPKVVSDA